MITSATKSLIPHWKIIAVCLLFLLGIAGCIEIIDFNVDREGNRLVVDGRITDSKGPHTVRLRLTSEKEKITDPSTGAEITIYDDLGNSEQFIEQEPGVYQLQSNTVKGEPGRTYHIEIKLPNGPVYRSEPETMPTSIARDSIYYEFDTLQETKNSGETNIVRVFRDTSIPAEADSLFLRWELEEVYKFTEYDFPDPFNNPPPTCYVTQHIDPQNIILLNSQEITEKNILGEVIAERKIDHTFYQRHFFNLIQLSISQNAHRYWSHVDEVVNSRGTIFDPPPATVESNIFNVDNPDEKVLGYFEAARVDTARFFLINARIPFYVPSPCRSLSRSECTNCGAFENSMDEPPFYWLDD